jgi:hypothetical protein
MSRTVVRFAATLAALTLAPVVGQSFPAFADEPTTYELTLAGAAFDPGELHVAAGKPFVIKVKNANAAPAEFEAKDMKIEKVVAGNSEIVVRVKALEPGKYLFVDEYQEDAAKGFVIAE